MAACEVAIDLGVHGPVNASALACASGTAALLEARRLILSGEADVVIAGGTDAAINEAMFAGLALMGPLSERNDEPALASRPFDLDRDGFVFGEGAVVLVVESAEHARAARRSALRHARRRRADLRRVPHERPGAQRPARRAGDRAGPAAAPPSPPRSSTTSAPTAPPPAPTTPPRPRRSRSRSATTPRASRPARRSRWSAT